MQLNLLASLTKELHLKFNDYSTNKLVRNKGGMI